MKKNIISVLLVLVMSIPIVSCTKENVIINDDITTSDEFQNKNSQKGNSNNINNGQLKKIGKLHNEYLQLGFENFNYTAIDVDEELKTQFFNINVPNISEEDKLAIVDDSTVYNMDYLSSVLEDKIALNYIQEIENLLGVTETYTELESSVNSKLLFMKDDVLCENKDVVKVYSEVLLSSAKFWLPLSEGGSGIGDDILGDIDELPGISPYARDIIAADGLGAAGTFVGYGLLAGLTGPIGWGALVAGVGFSAAWSSAAAALT
tara:strand:- start:83 stop:871 length:789 start_codon:yes stop_codon:yes gene_type:complete